MKYLAAVVQLTTTTDAESSFQMAEDLVAQAAGLGAKLIVLPENVNFMGTEEEKLKRAEPITGPSFMRLSDIAKRNHIHLIGGTLPESGPEKTRA